MQICYVIGAGEVKETFHPDETDFVIAADGGLEAARRLGITPHLIVGDFDSLGHIPVGENVRRLPVEKDETDVAAALRMGMAAGYLCFCIYGGTGGREDHTLANLQLLHRLAKEGGQGFLVGNGFIRTVIVNKGMQIAPQNSGTVSVFSLTNESRGVCIRGLKYTLEGETLYSEIPLGVSNSFIGERAEISVAEGALLVMWEDGSGRA